MTRNEYDVGDSIRLSAVFTQNSIHADPTSVVATHKDPSGNETTPAVSNPNAGHYFIDVSIDEEGTWWYRFAGTGAVEAAAEGTFNVRATQF